MSFVSIDHTPRVENRFAWSFDVFDTFLIRTCTTSTGVFERTYQLSRISDLCPNMSEHFVQHRILAESRVREAARSRGQATEISIDQIYARFPFRLFGLKRENLDHLIEAEFSAELELCRINPDMLEQYRARRRTGNRVGFISDTYWNTERLGRLLRACSPGLTWDFLYASCDHGSGKAEDLFATYLRQQGLDASSACHVGDNEHADVRGAKRHGIRSRHYPQAGPRLATRLLREDALQQLMFKGQPARLDHGARTLRRMVAARSAEKSAAHHLGATVVGPVLTAFDEFVATRSADLTADGRRVAIGFLGRDGFLSHRLWQQTRGEPAAYLEINRRVSLIASADTIGPICELIRKIPRIDAAKLQDMLKILPPALADYFGRCEGGIATGIELADALPSLVEPHEIETLAAGLRGRLLDYIRQQIPDLDDCTDLLLVDLGYSASVQKALSRVFKLAGLTLRVHGCYLLALGDACDELAEEDTVSALIDDLVLTPHLNRTLIRNAPIFEQICCSAEGSVRDYADGHPLREPDPRPTAQIEVTSEIQAGVLTYASAARGVAREVGLDPYRDLGVAARATATTLGRLLLLPDEEELALFDSFQHDVNLGTDTLAPMIHSAAIGGQIALRGLPTTCALSPPPMWMAGSFAAHSQSHAFLYALFGAGQLPGEMVGDRPHGSLRIGLFGADGAGSLQEVSVLRTGFGGLRLRIPLSGAMRIAMIAVPLGRLAREGLIDGVMIQRGGTAAEAMHAEAFMPVAADRLSAAGLTRNGRHYLAPDDDGCLLIPVEPADGITIYTVAVSPLGC